MAQNGKAAITEVLTLFPPDISFRNRFRKSWSGNYCHLVTWKMERIHINDINVWYMAHTLTETGNINRSSEVHSYFCMWLEWQKMVVATSIHTFPGSLSNNGRLQYQLPKHKVCSWFWLEKGKKKKKKDRQKGMQNRYKSMMSSGASCAVNGCNYNQRNLNNLLGMQCFDHMSLFG